MKPHNDGSEPNAASDASEKPVDADISEDTTVQMPAASDSEPGEAVVLDPIEADRIRFSGEATAASQLRANPWLQDLIVAAQARGRTDPARIRRRLQASAVRLTEGMAADVWKAARLAAERLGVDVDLEIHQASGAENPAIHLIESPALLEVRGRLLTLLDAPSTVAALGHEVGHYLAHGPNFPDATLGLVAKAALDLPDAPDHALRAASTLTLAREITADRFGLLACRDLPAALRLEMAATTGLATSSLTWDTTAYLEQCKALMDHALVEGTTGHAEHGLRAWALWLFSETETYQAMTGQGPGTRPLSDVDEQIARAIGVVGVAGLVDSALVPEPMTEIHECALAGAALVALADGELSEEESHAIETVFGTLVGDWQRYLVWDQALESFADTGSVVRAGGIAAQRAMFQVLVHVLAADTEVEAREVEMICAIGDALGCGELYRTLLAPVLAVLGDEPRDLSKITRTIPMPARMAEAETALEVFLRGIQRRGGGEASLRRMLRLLGDREGSQHSLDTVHRLLDRVGLVTDIDLDEVSLDQPLAFTLNDEARQEAYEKARTQRVRMPDPELGDARMRLSKGVARLRESLVSGDGRSPSIRLRTVRNGRTFDLHALESLSVGHGERTLTLVTNHETARLVDGREAGVHTGAAVVSQQLIALSREATARTEQTGSRDLYVGYPFLTGTVDGYFVRGPLVLHPYELERSEARGFQLVPRTAEVPIVNLALVRLVFQKKGLSFHEDLAETLDRAAADGADAVRQALADEGLRARAPADELTSFQSVEEGDQAEDPGRLVLEPCAVLGFFPQSTSDMIADYDDLLSSVADGRVPLADTLGAAGPLLPVEVREELCIEEEVEAAATLPIIPVLASDPSQRRVLQLARTQRLLVVDGPPGTGKSQVIVNLVADAMAR
ncbi:MAG: DUF4011 domain-containing protein, partial [Myxococcota bacterium]